MCKCVSVPECNTIISNNLLLWHNDNLGGGVTLTRLHLLRECFRSKLFTTAGGYESHVSASPN